MNLLKTLAAALAVGNNPAPAPRRRPLGWIGLQPRGLGLYTTRALTPAERHRVNVQRHAALDAAHSRPARTEAERKAAGLPHQGKREMARREVRMNSPLPSTVTRIVSTPDGDRLVMRYRRTRTNSRAVVFAPAGSDPTRNAVQRAGRAWEVQEVFEAPPALVLEILRDYGYSGGRNA